jgi:hypothetical protein
MLTSIFFFPFSLFPVTLVSQPKELVNLQTKGFLVFKSNKESYKIKVSH